MHLFSKRTGQPRHTDLFAPADPAFTQAIAALQWGLKHNRKIVAHVVRLRGFCLAD
jgi:hypothetical protein